MHYSLFTFSSNDQYYNGFNPCFFCRKDKCVYISKEVQRPERIYNLALTHLNSDISFTGVEFGDVLHILGGIYFILLLEGGIYF